MTDNDCCSLQTDPSETQDSESRLDECETAALVLRYLMGFLFYCLCLNYYQNFLLFIY